MPNHPHLQDPVMGVMVGGRRSTHREVLFLPLIVLACGEDDDSASDVPGQCDLVRCYTIFLGEGCNEGVRADDGIAWRSTFSGRLAKRGSCVGKRLLTTWSEGFESDALGGTVFSKGFLTQIGMQPGRVYMRTRTTPETDMDGSNAIRTRPGSQLGQHLPFSPTAPICKSSTSQSPSPCVPILDLITGETLLTS